MALADGSYISILPNPFFHSGINLKEELNKWMLTAYFFREVTFSIFDQRDGQKDDVTLVKKTKYVV